MKIKDIETIQALAEQRDTAMRKEKRLIDEPLRLVLGKGSGEIEIALTRAALAALRTAASDTVLAEIATLNQKLAALGVDIQP